MRDYTDKSRWYKLAFFDLNRLVRHELHDQKKADDLRAIIERSGIWSDPIVVERQYHIILDGHHRFEAACQLGLSCVPCALVDYDSDDLAVEAWRPGELVDRSAVRFAALSGSLMPIKTSRHIFSKQIAKEVIPLAALVKREAAYA